MITIDVPVLTPSALRERWHELAPVMPEEGHAELDEYGELILAPLPTNRHQRIAAWVGTQLQRSLGGETGCYAIITRIGVRVPDMCWTADASRFEADPADSAPEICVEVASLGNTPKWLLEEAAAYLAAGAREVVIIGIDERIRYYGETGERERSAFGVSLTLPPK